MLKLYFTSIVPSVNRTKVELKYFTGDVIKVPDSAVNRTNVELK